jgi:hypothetical protein
MKSFKNILSEVAQPKSSEEKAFKDQHDQKPGQHPVAPDSQFSGDIGKPKAARPADQEDDANYDQAYGDKPAQEPVLRKGRKFSQFRANESKEMATQAALDKATAASKEGKKKVTLAKAPWDKKEEVTEKVSDLAFAKWNEALSGKQKKLDHNKNGKIDGHDFAIMRGRKKSNEEVEVVETASSVIDKGQDVIGEERQPKDKDPKPTSIKSITTTKRNPMARFANSAANRHNPRPANEAAINELGRKTLGSYIKKAHSDKDRQVAKDKYHQAKGDTMDRDDDMYHQWGKANKAAKKAKNRTAGITRATDKLVRKESFTETLDEAVKVGNLRLNNGKNVKVSKQDAKLLNDFYKNLNAKNRRDMEKVMMKDDAGFKEIVGFAREAL